jgi:hypothetical protein
MIRVVDVRFRRRSVSGDFCLKRPQSGVKLAENRDAWETAGHRFFADKICAVLQRYTNVTQQNDKSTAKANKI